MHFAVTNVNVLGVALSITAQTGEQHVMVILPGMTGDFEFAVFGAEPMGWRFTPSIESDAAVVNWKVFSTWVSGDPLNG